MDPFISALGVVNTPSSLNPETGALDELLWG